MSTSTPIDIGKPLREGFLFKEGGSTKSWRKRYFALYPGLLVYYQKFSHYKKDREKGSFKRKINEISVEQCSLNVPDWQPHPHTFVLYAGAEQKNKRNQYVLSACSTEDQKLWFNALMSQSGYKGAVSVAPHLGESSLDQSRQADSDTDNWEWSDDDEDDGKDGDPPSQQMIVNKQQMTGEMEAVQGSEIINISSEEDNDIPGYAKVNKGQTATIPFSRDSLLREEYETCETHRTESGQDNLVPEGATELEGESAIDSSTTEDEDAQDQEPITQPTSETGTSSDSEEGDLWPKEQTKKLQPQQAIDIDEMGPKSLQGPHGQASPSGIKVQDSTSSSNSTRSSSTKSHESGRDTLQTAPIDSLPLKEGRKEEFASTTVIFHGILQKQGGRHKSWKFRYFRLFPGLLRYYATKSDMVPIHEIKLDGAKVLVPPGSTKRPYQFTLETKNSWNKRSEYILAASSEAERKEWIAALKRGGKMQKKTEFGTYDRKARTGAKGATHSPVTTPENSPLVTIKETTHSVQHPLSLARAPSPIIVRKQMANISSSQAAASPVIPHKPEAQNQEEVMKTATESLKVVAASSAAKEFLGVTVELRLPGSGKDRPISAMRMRSFEEVTEQHQSKEKKQSRAHLRHLVSKQKKRYVEGTFDLDLTYVTDKIIAMGFPSEGAESVYRNKLADVQRLLDSKHKGHYKLYNLCSERAYPANKFYSRVAYYPFDDHCAPTLPLVSAFCNDVHLWLTLDRENVAVVHCKAGKGRTGCLISAYLLHANAFSTADEALSYYGETRTYNRKGVTIPSQIRYVRYYEHCVKMGIPTTKRVSRKLEKIRMFTVPNVDSLGGCNPYYLIYQRNELHYSSKRPDQPREKGNRIVIHDCDVDLAGDVHLQLWDYDRFSGDELLCSIFFNTMFVDENNKLFFKRGQIDRACKKKKKEFSNDFCLELVFQEVLKKVIF